LIWKSSCKEQAAFKRAVRNDPDLVILHSEFHGLKEARTVGSVLDDLERDQTLIVLGENWRTHLRRAGRQIVIVSIRSEPRKSHRRTFRRKNT
jgi:hypothetical protein